MPLAPLDPATKRRRTVACRRAAAAKAAYDQEPTAANLRALCDAQAAVFDAYTIAGSRRRHPTRSSR
jgi:hypothetical protein